MSAEQSRFPAGWRDISACEPATTVFSFESNARPSSSSGLDIEMGFTMSSLTNVQTVVLDGKRFVILPESDYQRLVGLPPADADGNRPAVTAMRAVLARDIVRDRERVGWSQTELARRAGIRVETLNRIETGKHTPSVATIEKIDAALRAAASKTKRNRT
jgi:DNA-binding XRE family transcriptional regulator